MAIDLVQLKDELTITAGDYFKYNLQVIDSAIQTAIDTYTYLRPMEKAWGIYVDYGHTQFILPTDFREIIGVYPYVNLWTALFQAGYVEWSGTTFYQTLKRPAYYYIDLLVDKIEYFGMLDVFPVIKNYVIDSTNEGVQTLRFTYSPDPYQIEDLYVVHYYAYYTPENVPNYHYQHIFKLASSALMEKQATAMSKLVTTSGPNLTATYVNPAVLMTMAKDLKNDVVNALSQHVPEKG